MNAVIEQNKKRIEYIDIAKGLGIIFVVLGHCGAIPAGLSHFIFSFHMPLFFILSGFTFSRKNCDNLKAFVRKSFSMLIVPYLITAAIILVLGSAYAFIRHEDVGYAALKWLVSGLYGSGTAYPKFIEEAGIPITFIGAIWFLLALFFARILLALFLKSRTPFLWVMISFFVGYISARKIFWFPFSIQAGMCAVLFMYIGLLIKDKKLFEWKAVHWVAKLCMLLMWTYCIIFCGRMWMVSNSFTDGFVDIIGGICGTFIMVYISMGLEKIVGFRKLFIWLGKNSLGIMCGHVIVLDCWPMHNMISKAMAYTGVQSYVFWQIAMLFCISAVVCAVLYFIPWVGRKFFPNRRINVKCGQ